MTTLSRCPFCSSEKVYCLLDTFHCKRCKNIWKEEEDDFGPSDSCRPDAQVQHPSLRFTKKTAPLETRMKKRLEDYLLRSSGKFSMDTIAWTASDISPELFRRYLRRCVKNRELTETKDRNGRTWYSRPDRVSRQMSVQDRK
jgi:hypothetical protein